VAREVRIQNLEQQLAQAVAACRYDARRESREIARRVAPLLLGDKELRPFQLDAACALFDGRHTFVLRKAGDGKSVCYQLPALMRPPTPKPAPPKLTLVVMPLVALAWEQADELNSRIPYLASDGLPRKVAHVLDGASQSLFAGAEDGPEPSREELIRSLSGQASLPRGSPEDHLLERLQETLPGGDAMSTVLFVSPEKLVRSRALHALLRIAYEEGWWRCVAIDEAHCVDEHGLEFRHDYRLLGALTVVFPELTYMLLTATASPVTVQSLCITLGIETDPVVVRGTTRREQTAYSCIVCEDGPQKLRSVTFAVEAAHRGGKSTMVYTNSRRGTERLAGSFREVCGLPEAAPDREPCIIEAYHAGMDRIRRRELEAAWRDSVIRQLAATSAMGMGMDKRDIDAVYHHMPPRSLTALYQEAARAGRGPGRRSIWRWYVTLNDIIELFERRHGDLAQSEVGQGYGYGLCLDVLSFLLDETTCRHQLLESSLGAGTEECDPCPDDWQCDNCLRRCSCTSTAAVDADAVEIAREQWTPALLRAMGSLAQPSLTLRSFAKEWLRLRDGPTPLWTRVPLLLHALFHNVLRVTFRPVSRPAAETDDVPIPVRWVAIVSIDAHGRRAAHSSPALALLRLHKSLWRSDLAGDADVVRAAGTLDAVESEPDEGEPEEGDCEEREGVGGGDGEGEWGSESGGGEDGEGDDEAWACDEE